MKDRLAGLMQSAGLQHGIAAQRTPKCRQHPATRQGRDDHRAGSACHAILRLQGVALGAL